MPPKEQPPRKLSGHRTARAIDTLESASLHQGRATEGVSEARATRRLAKLSGFPTEGAAVPHPGTGLPFLTGALR